MLDLEAKVFQCPNCKQFINNSMTVCKFCSVELDPNLISGLVENQEKVNAAYNSASSLRTLAGAMWLVFFLSFIPILGFFASLGFYGIVIAIPILLIVWYVKYGNLKTTDAEFKTAKKYLYTAFFIWLIYPALLFVITVLMIIGAASLSK